MINYKLKIDCQGEKTLYSDIVFVSGDVGAYKLTVDFFDDGEGVDITNCTLVMRAKRADGSCVSVAGSVVDGNGVFVPKNSLYAIPGEVSMEIALCDDAKNYITTKIIIAEVIEGLGNKCEPEADEVSVFVALMNQVNAKITEVNKLIQAATPQRGRDYWTDEDKAEIKSYVDEAIIGGAW